MASGEDSGMMSSPVPAQGHNPSYPHENPQMMQKVM